MGIREDFYTALGEQFIDDPSGSFLFHFLREERLRKKTDKTFAQASLDELLGLLADRNQKLQLNEEDRTWILALGARAGGEKLREVLEYTRGDRGQYKRIQEALRGHPELVTEKERNKLRRIVLDAVVMQEARTFLYDAGFSMDQKELRPDRKENRMLKMLDAWCEDTGHSLCQKGASGPSALTAEERQAWNEMFQLLQKKPTRIILPVRVDTRTGVGLYLVGALCFTRKVRQMMKDPLNKKQTLNCVFVCLGPSDFYNDDDGIDDETDDKIANGFHLEMRPIKGYTIFGVTLEDGEKMFSYILNSQLAKEFIRDWNDTAPQGTPKLLKIYFRSAQREKLDGMLLVAEGRQASEQDEKFK